MTNSGQELIASALSGSGTVTFTSVKTSSYAYPQGTNISGLTDLQAIVQTEMPFSAEVFNETMLQVSARFDNSQVTGAYLIQTIGVYAQIGSEPEVLFAVIQADTPDQMPAQSAVSPSAFIYNIQITVQQATSISVAVNPAGTATVQDILGLQQQVNARVESEGGSVSDTTTDVQSPSGSEEYPTIPASGGIVKTVLGNIVRWLNTLRNNKVDLSGGDVSNTEVNTVASQSAQYPVPSAGDSVAVMVGKIIKFFQDIRSTAIGACYIGQLVSNNTTNNPNLPASAAAVYQEAQLRAQQFAQLNSDILGPDELVTNLRWIPQSALDNPNSFLGLTGWQVAPYVSYTNLVDAARWSVIIGIYDNDNGQPLGRQVAIGTSGIFQRRNINGIWDSWTAI